MDLRPLPTERDGDAVRLLGDAFFDYPTWDALAPQAPARRWAMIRRYYGAYICTRSVPIHGTSGEASDARSSAR